MPGPPNKGSFTPKRERTGGRVAGTPNKATAEIKRMIDEMVPPAEFKKRWKKYLDADDIQVSFRAFELMLHYRFGRPIQTVVGSEDAPAINVNVSAIPKFRVEVIPDG